MTGPNPVEPRSHHASLEQLVRVFAGLTVLLAAFVVYTSYQQNRESDTLNGVLQNQDQLIHLQLQQTGDRGVEHTTIRCAQEDTQMLLLAEIDALLAQPRPPDPQVQAALDRLQTAREHAHAYDDTHRATGC